MVLSEPLSPLQDLSVHPFGTEITVVRPTPLLRPQPPNEALLEREEENAVMETP